MPRPRQHPSSPSTPTLLPPTPQHPPSILLVCLGNICRSPMAHAVLASHNTPSSFPSSPLPLRAIDSAGTAAYHATSPPDPRTLAVLDAHPATRGFAHEARKVTPEDFEAFDLVLGMDADNVADLREARREAVAAGLGRGRREGGAAAGAKEEDGLARVMLFGDFGGEQGEEVADPYYGGAEGFEAAYEQVARMSKGLVAWAEGGRKSGTDGT